MKKGTRHSVVDSNNRNTVRHVDTPKPIPKQNALKDIPDRDFFPPG